MRVQFNRTRRSVAHDAASYDRRTFHPVQDVLVGLHHGVECGQETLLDDVRLNAQSRAR
jgi:hypothetical protein